MPNFIDKYKILFIVPRIPYPLDTGAKIRTYNLLKYLGKRHSVILACFQWHGQNDEHKKELERIVSRVICVPINKYSPLQLVAGVFFSKLPGVIKKYINRKMSKAVSGLIKSEKFDIIHCDHLHTAHYGMNIAKIKRVLDEHNIESVIWRRYYETQRNIFKRIAFKAQWKKMIEYEKRAAETFDCCCVVSLSDGENLRALSPQSHYSVISNGVDVEYFKPDNRQCEPGRIVFTGSMNWLPNDDAMIYFINEIMPFIRNKLPGVKLSIVGQSPSESLKRLARGYSDIEVTGRVDDVRPYIARSCVYIVPLRIGGGTRLKILEAMAMGRPVVSTTIGYEGIEAIPEEHILAADKPEKFAERVVELMANRRLIDSLSAKGRKLVEEKYSWDIIGNLLEGVYRELLK